ncbi:SufB/SufD family protein [Butyrivibrio sp. MC2013]|uniref:SufB/SufD family protein n=1 Tax=Butyrivibrio sp. MC2013 TaxID=1280686 RepID=UPI000401ED7D|nr:SufD family Fe-S cluster assembly protein [Butyrivibrio sp. MC2013]
MNIDMQVNKLPARTYRWLKLNGEKVAVKDASFDRTSLRVSNIPTGVTLVEGMSLEESDEFFEDLHKICESRDADEALPNGDNDHAGKSQLVRTGMGSDMDRLIEASECGVTYISCGEGCEIAEPVVLSGGGDGSGVSSQLIRVPKGASMTVIMDMYSQSEDQALEAVSTRFLVEKDAFLKLVKVQMLGRQVTYLSDLGGMVLDGGRFEMVEMELGASKSYSGICVNLMGDHSSSLVNTGYMASGKQFYDFNYIAEQRGVKTDSEAVFRGVLTDKATKNWRGSLDFRKGSKKSVGDEQEDTLLLSPEVINRTIPLILCGEEDVDGHHGASIGQLSDDMLFYMESRGIDKEEARKIMIRARLDSIARMIPEGKLRNHVSRYLDEAI